MLHFQGQKILKHKFFNSSGQEVLKTYKFITDIEKSETYSLHKVKDIQSNIIHTLKIIFKSHHFQKDKIVTQIKNMKLFCGKENFINLYDVYQDENSIFMIMQQWGITLGQLIRRRAVLLQYEVQIIFSQLVNILSQLRSNNISHGNISLQSIYVDLKKNHLIKLGLFSKSFDLKYYFQEVVNICNSEELQKIMNQYKKQLTSQNSSITHLKRQKQQRFSVYTSPEKLKLSSVLNSQNQYLKVQQLYDNDIWSMGVILFRLLVGRFPFVQNQNFDEDDWIQPSEPKLEMIKQPLLNFNNPFINLQNEEKYWRCQNISAEFKQLILRILSVKSKRIKLKDLINHPLKLNNYHRFSQQFEINLNSSYAPLTMLNMLHLQNNIKELSYRSEQKLQNFERLHSKYSQLSLYSPQKQNLFFNQKPKKKEIQSKKYNQIWSLNFQRQFNEFTDNNQQQNQKQKTLKKFINQHQKIFDNYQKKQNKNLTKQKDLQFIFQQDEDFKKQNFPAVQQCGNNNFSNLKKMSKSSYFKQDNKLKTSELQNQKTQKQSNALVLKPNRFTIRSIKDKKNIINSKNIVESNSYTTDINFLTSNSLVKNNHPNFSTKINNFSDGFQLNKNFQQKKSNNYPQLNKLNGKHTISTIQQHHQFSDEESFQNSQFQNQNLKIQNKLISNRSADMPLIIQEPTYVYKYKYKKQYDSFGYVLDHGIGVIFSDGQHVIGHDQNDYKYIQNNNKVLPASKMAIFKYYLSYFGKRVIYGSLSVWIQKYWKDGKIFVFLMSNGCWQVCFQLKKICKFYIIDQNDLCWNKQNAQVDVLNIVRTIVNAKKKLYFKSQSDFYTPS